MRFVLANQPSTIVTTHTISRHTTVVEIQQGPVPCTAMTRFTLVRARDVRATFAGRFDPVVTTNAITCHTNMIKPTGDGKAYTRRIVASIARRVGRNMSRPLAHRNGTVMTSGTFRRSTLEHAADMTGFTGSGLVGTKQWITGLKVVKTGCTGRSVSEYGLRRHFCCRRTDILRS